jgi:hypothetical protein
VDQGANGLTGLTLHGAINGTYVSATFAGLLLADQSSLVIQSGSSAGVPYLNIARS